MDKPRETIVIVNAILQLLISLIHLETLSLAISPILAVVIQLVYAHTSLTEHALSVSQKF